MSQREIIKEPKQHTKKNPPQNNTPPPTKPNKKPQANKTKTHKNQPQHCQLFVWFFLVVCFGVGFFRSFIAVF